ncbi:isoform 4 of fibroblast growth factor receptor 1-A [Fusarium mundagurra]|uniref:Isoform 4 of fibroblast growth factor receptor 1-A n=1 Tax=Fusarium mundagurra TaxID=1567541 RepID=A0A8H5Z3Q2_9HYPO|nr:isoform 4 of fibroblast growth factor receptor 1-A [Fusarium mundagurra]
MVDYFSAGSDVLNLPNTLTNIVSAVQKISTQRRSGKEKCAELLVDAFTLKDMIESPHFIIADLQKKRLEKLIVRIKDCLNPTPVHSSTHITVDISALNWQDSIGRGKVTGYGDLECRKLDTGLSSLRALSLYQDLQQGAHIQKIHGIVEMNEQDYVVMQGCSTLPTLKSWRSDPSRVLTLRDRVLIAYDVAQSITWLHGGGLLVKYLTESSIRLRSDQKTSRQHPVLTQLHYTRCLYEKTNSVRIDHRYEAQEILADLLERKGSVPHSHETDIWSLGVIVWQILTDGTPYLIEEPMYFYNHEQDATTLKSRLETHHFPGSFPSEFPSPLIDVVHSCWSPIDQGRPSAMAVASSLLRACTLLDKTVMSTVKDCVGDSVKIESSQDLGMARLAAWQLVHKARKRAKVRDGQVGQLSNHHASVLVRRSENPQHPECAFLVGALIWWDLINVWLVDDTTSPRSHLGFDASDKGYIQANFEITRAYAALCHDYNARSEVVRDM